MQIMAKVLDKNIQQTMLLSIDTCLRPFMCMHDSGGMQHLH